MADEKDNKKQDSNTGSSESTDLATRSAIGALLGGGLGALGGAYLTDAPEDMAPSDVFKERLKNALVTGLLGAVGGGGLGFVTGKLGIGTAAPSADAYEDDLKRKYGIEGFYGRAAKKGIGAVGGYAAGRYMLGAPAAHLAGMKKGLQPHIEGRIRGVPGLVGAVAGGIYGDDIINAAEDGITKLITRQEEQPGQSQQQ